MKKLNTRGFTAIEGLLILAIVAIVGGAGYFVFKAKDNTNKTYDSSSQGYVTPGTTEKKTAKKSEEGYLIVSEWGVKIPVKSGRAIYYKIKTNASDSKYGFFYTKKAESLCPDTDNVDTFEHHGISVLRGKANDTFTNEGGEKQTYINFYDTALGSFEKSYGYYIKPFMLADYYYIPPSTGFSSCSAIDATQSKVDSELAYIRSAIDEMKLR